MQMTPTPSSKKSPENNGLRTLVVMASICLFALVVVQAQTGCDAGSETKLSAEPKAQSSSRPAPSVSVGKSSPPVPALAASSEAEKPSPSKAAGQHRKGDAKSAPSFFGGSKSWEVPLPELSHEPPVGQGSNKQ